MKVVVKADILGQNEAAAAENAALFARHGIYALNLLGSPGCGKTSLLEQTLAALGKLDLSALDLLVIENVGNLVCPAEFALGEDAKAVALSITEGDDKPLKYPLIFKESAVALLNKVDILPYTNFNMEAAERDITALHPGIAVLPVSCRTGEGLSAWYDWLRAQVQAKKKQA